MPFDVYQSCPCGSGKKLKFCCQAVAADMERVSKYRENEQDRLALQVLDGLEKSHADNPWVIVSKAGLLLRDSQPLQAKQMLERLLDGQPDHTLAIALYATAAFAAEGYQASRRAIHRALQLSSAAFPSVVGGLAMGIADEMFNQRRYLAARQYLVLAMRVFPDSARQTVFQQLLEFDGDANISYPLRSAYHLAPYSGSDETKRQVQQARGLAGIGCWGPAARVFADVADKDAQNDQLWRNIGLCRAWDGDNTGAAQALRKAAELSADFQAGVEYETLAQLLDESITTDRVDTIIVDHEVKSASRLLSLLDDEPRAVRLEVAPEQGVPSAAGQFELIDRPADEAGDPKTASLESIPTVLGRVVVFDAIENDDQSSHAYLVGFEGPSLDEARKLLESVAGDEVERVKPDDENEPNMPIDSVPTEMYRLLWRAHFSDDVSAVRRATLIREHWQKAVHNTWLKSPLSALGGMTPEQAAEDASLKRQLTAAVYALDSYCEQHRHGLEVAELWEPLKLKAPEPIDVESDAALHSFSALQLHRLPVEQLSDDRLSYILKRALLQRHRVFLYRVLVEAMKRPQCAEKVGLASVYDALITVCDELNRRGEALKWIEQAKEFAKTEEKPFELIFGLQMRELAIRTEDPDDPETIPLVRQMLDYYGPKVPRFAEAIGNLLRSRGIDSPVELSQSTMESQIGVGAKTSGGLWTPNAETEPEGEKKLWIPGDS